MKLKDSDQFQAELKQLMKKYDAYLYPVHTVGAKIGINLEFGITQGLYDIEDITMINSEGLVL